MFSRVYLDHNAGSPLLPSVRMAMVEAMDELGNPMALHGSGRRTYAMIEKARGQVAQLLGCDPDHIVFTSGATEANALALQETQDLLWAADNHASLCGLNPDDALPVDRAGRLDLEELDRRVQSRIAARSVSDPFAVSVAISAANSETGVCQDVEAIAQVCMRRGVALHVDATQRAGKNRDLNMSAWLALGVSSVSVSAHKWGGPAGVGGLIKSPWQPRTSRGVLNWPGGQERGRRPGTHNFLGIVGMGAAAAHCGQEAHWEDVARWHGWMSTFEESITKARSDVMVIGRASARLGQTSCLCLPDMTAQTRLIALDLRGFDVSAGPACSAGSLEPSTTLLAMGLPPRLAACCLRISAGWTNVSADFPRLLMALRESSGGGLGARQGSFDDPLSS